MQKITADSPDAKSADIVSQNLDHLRALFPDAWVEGKLDFEVLRQLLGGVVDEREEKFGLNWHGKRKARQLALTPSTGTLRPCPKESEAWDTTQNLMIEGDNLETLKLLQKSYAGLVKMIFIDPPYNTGRDFVYADDFRDNIKNYLELTGQIDGGRKIVANTEASGRFHTDWLSMMLPRLYLSRHLLKDDGLIFISIDEHEISRLRQTMDEVFGEENFVCQICVVSNPRGRQSESVATTHEYLVAYAKNSELCSLRGEPLTSEQLKEFKFTTADGKKYRTRGLRHRGNASRRVDRPKMFYPLYVDPTTKAVSLERTQQFREEVLPKKSTGEDGRWEWGPETAQKRLALLEGVLISGRNEWDVFQREFLGGDGGQDEDDEKTTKWKSVWDEKNINYQNGKTELKKLFADSPFDYPKPLYLLRKIIDGTTDSDDIVLDFFAGSGTTGHAVWESNATDNNVRRYILVQLPEPTRRLKSEGVWEESEAWKAGYQTVSAITIERLRRASKQIKSENPLYSGDLGFRVYRLDSSNIREWDPKRDDMAATLDEHSEHLKAGRTEDDILTELLLKLGIDLCVPIESRKISDVSVYSIGAGTLFACLPEKITRAQVKPLGQGILAWRQELKVAVKSEFVFRDSAFADDVAKTNLSAYLEQNLPETQRGRIRSL